MRPSTPRRRVSWGELCAAFSWLHRRAEAPYLGDAKATSYSL